MFLDFYNLREILCVELSIVLSHFITAVSCEELDLGSRNTILDE